MFHVSTIMSADQIRRLIGNDVGMIIFQEETPVSLSIMDDAGTVPQVFACVRPNGEDSYE